MPVNTTTQVLGAKEAIRSLRRIDPEVRRQFTRDAKQAVAPIVDEAVSKYPPEALSGMARKWKAGNRQLFPYDRTKAVRGLKLKVDTSRRSESVIKLVQTNPAAAIFEVAGSAGGGSLGRNLNDKFGRASRLLWPIAERRLPQVTEAVHDLVMTAVRRVNREL